MNIIVIDDEATLVDLILRFLSLLGYTGEGFNTAKEALKSEETYECAILDFNMPVIDGRQAADLLKEKYPGIKIIFSTGEAQNPPQLKEGERLLRKPFKSEDLFKILREEGS